MMPTVVDQTISAPVPEEGSLGWLAGLLLRHGATAGSVRDLGGPFFPSLADIMDGQNSQLEQTRR